MKSDGLSNECRLIPAKLILMNFQALKGKEAGLKYSYIRKGGEINMNYTTVHFFLFGKFLCYTCIQGT